MVRPRPGGAGGEEPRIAGRRTHRTRRRPARRACDERACALRGVGAPEPGDAWRRSHAGGRSARALRSVGDQRERGRRAAHRQLAGHRGDGRTPAAGRPRRPASALSVASIGSVDDVRALGPDARDGGRLMARAAQVANRHQRRRRSANACRGAVAPAGCAPERRRPSRRRSARRRLCARSRAARSASAVRRLARRGALRAPPARGHPGPVLELARRARPTRPARGRPPAGRHRSSARRRARGGAVPRRARPRHAGAVRDRPPTSSPSAPRSAISWRPHRRRACSANRSPLPRSRHCHRRWPGPPPR